MSKEPKRRAFTLTLPENMIAALDGLAEQVEDTRSGIIEAMLEYCLEEEHLDELFPYEDEEDGEKDTETDGGTKDLDPLKDFAAFSRARNHRGGAYY